MFTTDSAHSTLSRKVNWLNFCPVSYLVFINDEKKTYPVFINDEKSYLVFLNDEKTTTKALQWIEKTQSHKHGLTVMHYKIKTESQFTNYIFYIKVKDIYYYFYYIYMHSPFVDGENINPEVCLVSLWISKKNHQYMVLTCVLLDKDFYLVISANVVQEFSISPSSTK